MQLKRYLFVAIWCLVALPTFGQPVFVPTFTANFNTFFGANAAAAQLAFNTVAASLASNLSENIHINITVDAVSDTSIFGQSSFSLFSISYTSLYNAALQNSTSADDAQSTGAGGSLGGTGTSGSATDPVGGSHNWWVTRAQRKALGLVPDDSITTDGTVTFGAGWIYTFSGPIALGTFDFQGVVAHELTEVMGRFGLCGASIGTPAAPGYTLLDAFSFSGAATRNTGGGANANFSIDNGSTLLKAFNDSGNGGDCRDWASGTSDSFNAFSSSGVTNPVTGIDLRTMDVIGYELSSVAKRRRGQITSQ